MVSDDLRRGPVAEGVKGEADAPREASRVNEGARGDGRSSEQRGARGVQRA